MSSAAGLRALCVVNPNARAAKDQADTFVAALRARGYAVDLHWSDSQEDALKRIESAEPADALLIGGGDGTISGLLPALLERSEPVGILPLGTANDFARGLAIPQDAKAAAGVIAEGRRVRVDTAVVNDRPFLNVASLGISVEIAGLHEDGAKKLIGRFAYPMRWAEAWQRHRPLRLSLSFDGTTRRIRCSLLAVGCGRHYGGGLTLDEEARLDDGDLRLYYISPQSALHWIRFLPGLWRGTLRSTEGAFTAKTREVLIEARGKRPMRVNVDGEIAAETPIRVTVRPRSLEVFAPADGSVRDGLAKG